ncbi:MAG: hypothetical protein ACLFVO_22390 [Chloroflexaceae bacterium]
MDHEHHEMSEHRETTNADMYQAIPRLAGDRASGRVEPDILLEKKYPAAAGEADVHPGKRPVCVSTV